MLTMMAMAAAVTLSGQEYAPQGPEQRVAPRGSYARSCSGEYVNRGRLYADCRDMRGNLRGTSIELRQCADHEIANDNGLLICGPYRGSWEGRDHGGDRDDRWDRPGGGWDRPGGGWDRPGGGRGGGWGSGRQSITVFTAAGYGGESRSFRGEVTNLEGTRLNDQISSLRVQGAWEACEHAYFRGHCEVFEGDVSNLNRTALNDRISSLRPVRGGYGGGYGGGWDRYRDRY